MHLCLYQKFSGDINFRASLSKIEIKLQKTPSFFKSRFLPHIILSTKINLIEIIFLYIPFRVYMWLKKKKQKKTPTNDHLNTTSNIKKKCYLPLKHHRPVTFAKMRMDTSRITKRMAMTMPITAPIPKSTPGNRKRIYNF